MRVSELAKEYGLSAQDILGELKSLKLKAKDGKQELSEAALAVVKRSLEKNGKKIVLKPKEERKLVVEAKTSAKKEVAKSGKDKVVKATLKKKIVSGARTKEAKKTAKKVVVKKVVKNQAKPTAKKVVSENVKNVSAKAKPKVTAKTKEPASVKAIDQKKKKVVLEKKKVETKKESLPAKEEPQVKQSAPKLVEKPIEKVLQPIEQKKFVYQKNFRKRHGYRSSARHSQQAKVADVPDPSQGPKKNIEIDFPISIKDLAVKLQQKPSVVLKVLMQKGVFATINQVLDEEGVNKILTDLNFSYIKEKTQEEQLLILHEEDKPELLKARPPVITFMGHVDHGKTSLLDRIRKSNITDKEHGGITQHMAAYSVKTPKGSITFLDTPGHAAFTSMRARGAHITDLVILVVAADEGVMPQTEEAIDHARAAGVPIVVAVNKMDKRNADIDKVKKQLSDRDLSPEDWGGKTVVVGVSAETGDGVNDLLEMIILEAEMLELKANPDRSASGIVVEAHLSHGKGAMASIIVQAGTLRDGDIAVAGPYFGRIKAMFDDHDRPINEAPPATPVEILGLSGIPEAGEVFHVVPDEKTAKEIALRRTTDIKNKKLQASQKITLEDLYSQIQQGKIRELNIVMKADVQGSLEALKDSLGKLANDEVQIKFIHTGTGNINAADVILAGASNAIIVGFHVDTDSKAKEEIEKQNVDLRQYRIIYDAVDDIKKALSGLLEPKIKKIFLGRVEIRQVFKLSKSGIVAGSFVQKGKVTRKAKIIILRNGEEVFSGEIDSLKRFKDDVREVREGFECGVTIKGFDQVQAGDIIEAFELETIQREL
ncbi:MAG: translation initiation factor IF-2 [Candidatus Omnitrophica bacterium]|nr:translation initiation factor IF-2 [Candidatus Omnitrophota bacterium]